MTDIAIQMWTVREDADRDLPGTLARLKQVGYKSVETAGLYGRTPGEVARLLEDNGLRLASAHHALPEPDQRVEAFDALAELGATMCFASLHEEHWTSEDTLQRAVEKLNAAVDAGLEWGIHFGYHNHWWEFTRQIGTGAAYERFLEIVDPRTLLEIDTYWVEAGGSSATDLLSRLHSRAPCLHIKDGPGDQVSSNVAVGDGALDISAILAAGSDAAWLIVEMDKCDGDLWAAVDRSLRYLRAH